MLPEPGLPGLAIVGHRPLREVASLVGLDPHTPGGRHRKRDEEQATHKKHDAVKDIT
jgi:hypothetical protein